jgi:superfamily II DNA or RNA helicase
MPDLSLLSLKSVYDSAEHHIVNDLIIPLLSNSTIYTRGVGYFSSGWLSIAAEGLYELVLAGGKAKLIMSPILDEKDWQAIILGQQAKENKPLRDSLSCAVVNLVKSLETNTLNTFAWMIADDLLDIRFAVPRAGYLGGDYHDKVAYFKDIYGNIVAIHGSFNDSIKGTLNGEAFSVFCSWISGHERFIQQHVSRLDRLWNNENPQFHAFKLPEAIRQQIVKLRSTLERPYQITTVTTDTLKVKPNIPSDIKLHDYQQEAIKAWQDNNCCGIFEMATGSGKTFTALGAAVEEFKIRKKLAIVILVPYIHLLNQWQEICEKFGFKPILCGSFHVNWRPILRSAVSDFRLSGMHLCVISVHQTASSPHFIQAFDKIPPKQKLIIADEVHRLGASQLRNALHNGFILRLGLSATPKRWYDEEGTQIIFDYFDKICYELTLKDAIERQFLVPYCYEPQIVYLTESEEHNISELSALIGKLFGKKKVKGLDEKEQIALEKAMIDRALVVKKAAGKFDTVKQLIQRLRREGEDFQHSLFYSPESQHREVLQLLKNEGIMAHQFISEDSPNDRKRILADFDAGYITSLVAMKCLDEGVDIPSIRKAFFIASTTNPKEFIQRRGRVLRCSANKTKACIYDFIVVPSSSTPRDVAIYLLEREMPRFAEFSDLAENSFAARSIIRPILDEYQMLHLLDMKPWDMYHRQNPETRDEMR